MALNYQTDDKQNLLNRALFMGNGGCGYILKPEFLRWGQRSEVSLRSEFLRWCQRSEVSLRSEFLRWGQWLNVSLRSEFLRWCQRSEFSLRSEFLSEVQGQYIVCWGQMAEVSGLRLEFLRWGQRADLKGSKSKFLRSKGKGLWFKG